MIAYIRKKNQVGVCQFLFIWELKTDGIYLFRRKNKLFFFPSGSIESVNKNSFEIFVTRLEWSDKDFFFPLIEWLRECPGVTSFIKIYAFGFLRTSIYSKLRTSCLVRYFFLIHWKVIFSTLTSDYRYSFSIGIF